MKGPRFFLKIYKSVLQAPPNFSNQHWPYHHRVVSAGPKSEGYNGDPDDSSRRMRLLSEVIQSTILIVITCPVPITSTALTKSGTHPRFEWHFHFRPTMRFLLCRFTPSLNICRLWMAGYQESRAHLGNQSEP